jgi:hypothetical protein
MRCTLAHGFKCVVESLLHGLPQVINRCPYSHGTTWNEKDGVCVDDIMKVFSDSMLDSNVVSCPRYTFPAIYLLRADDYITHF